MWAFRGSSGASSSTSPLVAGGGQDGKLAMREAPNCYVEVYDQHELKQGALVAVPQLLQCWTGGLLKRERVCSWLSLDLVREVTDVYIQHWSLTAEGMAVKLLLFDEARAKKEGSPFRNGARIVVCCCGEPLCIDAAARIQAAFPSHPLCRALTLGLLEMRHGSARSRECANRRAEIWTIVEQLQSVVLWTEEAQKRCVGRGQDVNAECLILVYHLLTGLTVGTDSLERLDAAREQLRQEYTAVRQALCGLNLHISRLFDNLQRGVDKEEPGSGEAEEEDTIYNDMLHVAGRMLNGHSKIMRGLFGSCLPLSRLDSVRSRVASCTCLVSRPARILDLDKSGPGDGDELEKAAIALQDSSGPLPSRVPGAARASLERRQREGKLKPEEVLMPSLANSVQAGAQLDQLWRSTHHL